LTRAADSNQPLTVYHIPVTLTIGKMPIWL
jgi:hypothetical protein